MASYSKEQPKQELDSGFSESQPGRNGPFKGRARFVIIGLACLIGLYGVVGIYRQWWRHRQLARPPKVVTHSKQVSWEDHFEGLSGPSYGVLGSGRSGTVFHVRAKRSLSPFIQQGHLYALKASRNVPGAADLLRKEAGILEKLQHVPGIVRLLAVYDQGTSVSLVLELLHGPSAESVVSSLESKHLASSALQQRQDNLEKAWGWAAELYSAVVQMHQAGIVHGDLHLGNVVFSDRQSGHPVIIDFSLATTFEDRSDRMLSWEIGLFPQRVILPLFLGLSPPPIDSDDWQRVFGPAYVGRLFREFSGMLRKKVHGQHRLIFPAIASTMSEYSDQLAMERTVLEILQVKDPFTKVTNSPIFQQLDTLYSMLIGFSFSDDNWFLTPFFFAIFADTKNESASDREQRAVRQAYSLLPISGAIHAIIFSRRSLPKLPRLNAGAQMQDYHYTTFSIDRGAWKSIFPLYNTPKPVEGATIDQYGASMRQVERIGGEIELVEWPAGQLLPLSYEGFWRDPASVSTRSIPSKGVSAASPQLQIPYGHVGLRFDLLPGRHTADWHCEAYDRLAKGRVHLQVLVREALEREDKMRSILAKNNVLLPSEDDPVTGKSFLLADPAIVRGWVPAQTQNVITRPVSDNQGLLTVFLSLAKPLCAGGWTLADSFKPHPRYVGFDPDTSKVHSSPFFAISSPSSPDTKYLFLTVGMFEKSRDGESCLRSYLHGIVNYAPNPQAILAELGNCKTEADYGLLIDQLRGSPTKP